VYGTKTGIDHDIAWLGPTGPERIHYQTQKPLGLLERIIGSSCPEGGVILDPFCGCGTAVIAAQKLNRVWRGIDVTWVAIDLIERRLKDSFGQSAKSSYSVQGNPRDVPSAVALAHKNKKEFEIWAVTLVEAVPREWDGGVDGLIGIVEPKNKFQKVVVQIKGGDALNPGMVRDLIGTVGKEGAVIGLLITLRESTSGMRELAAHSSLPSYHSPITGKSYSPIQIRTVGELLEGKAFDLPPSASGFRRAGRVREVGQTERML